MQLVQSQEVEAVAGRRRLLCGSPGRPDNYEFSLDEPALADAASAAAPCRRSFDQVWFDLGHEVRYLPESTHYDPRELERGTATLLLRCGGASGLGFSDAPAPDAGYAKPRYEAPVVMDTASFEWMQASGGLQRKVLGVFSERGLKVGLMRADAGAAIALSGNGAPRLLYALAGSGTVNGRRWSEGAALGLAAAEAVTLRTDTPCTWFFVRLQRFDA